jgi:hypothetical protein
MSRHGHSSNKPDATQLMTDMPAAPAAAPLCHNSHTAQAPAHTMRRRQLVKPHDLQPVVHVSHLQQLLAHDEWAAQAQATQCSLPNNVCIMHALCMHYASGTPCRQCCSHLQQLLCHDEWAAQAQLSHRLQAHSHHLGTSPASSSSSSSSGSSTSQEAELCSVSHQAITETQ